MALDLVKKINDAGHGGCRPGRFAGRSEAAFRGGVFDAIAAGPDKFTKIVASEVDTYETLARDMNLQR